MYINHTEWQKTLNFLDQMEFCCFVVLKVGGLEAFLYFNFENGFHCIAQIMKTDCGIRPAQIYLTGGASR